LFNLFDFYYHQEKPRHKNFITKFIKHKFKSSPLINIWNGDHEFFLKLSVVLELTHINSGCPHRDTVTFLQCEVPQFIGIPWKSF